MPSPVGFISNEGGVLDLMAIPIAGSIKNEGGFRIKGPSGHLPLLVLFKKEGNRGFNAPPPVGSIENEERSRTHCPHPAHLILL